ncbi:MAG: GNAT family N-acetyltransferase [Thermoanaerobaculaceae bacterium]|nr:GNAT family N-acetyltransferase [Thermoanaerobaculaceae bacterium]
MTLKLLQPPVDPAFYPMTYPAFRHLLELQPTPKLLHEPASSPIQPVAVGAWAGPKPVGLMLAGLPLVEGEPPELLSVYVVPEARGQGLGRELAKAAERVAQTAGFPALAATWTQGASGTAWWEHQLGVLGWEEPERRTLSVFFTAEEALRVPWLDRFRVREGCEIVPFVEVTQEELAALQHSQEQSPWIAPDLLPWRYLAGGFEERTSVALRSPEGIVGWVINHRVTKEWLRFTCSYIRKDWGRRARILPLFSVSFHRMVEAGFTRATFVAPVHHPTMVRFVAKHIAPWVSVTRWTLGSCKKFAHQDQACGRTAGEEGLCQERG